MIEIYVSDTGFVSGDAWETVGYEGELGSRTIHTVYTRVGNDNALCGYMIRSMNLGLKQEVYLDKYDRCNIPDAYMTKGGTLSLYFFIKDGTNYLMKSNCFELYIDSNSVDGGCSCPKDNDARNFIVVDTILDRDSIPRIHLADGKIVKVNDVGNGKSLYFSWNDRSCTWYKQDIASGEELDRVEKRIDQAFITVETVLDRDTIPKSDLSNGKLIRVNDTGDGVKYYSWDTRRGIWNEEPFGKQDNIEISQVNGLQNELDNINLKLSWGDI